MENIKHSLHARVKCSNVTQAHLSSITDHSKYFRVEVTFDPQTRAVL